MTISQRIKWERKLIAGKGNKYYPKDLTQHLQYAVPDCEHCKNMLATNLTIRINIANNGGQYRPHNPRRYSAN